MYGETPGNDHYPTNVQRLEIEITSKTRVVVLYYNNILCMLDGTHNKPRTDYCSSERRVIRHTRRHTYYLLTSRMFYDVRIIYIIIYTRQRLVVAFRKEQHGLGRPFRRLQQALALRVLTQGAQQHLVRVRHVRQQGFPGGRLVVQLQVMVKRTVLVACGRKPGFVNVPRYNELKCTIYNTYIMHIIIPWLHTKPLVMWVTPRV